MTYNSRVRDGGAGARHQVAGMAVETRSSHTEPQARGRESELEVVAGFCSQSPAPSNILRDHVFKCLKLWGIFVIQTFTPSMTFDHLSDPPSSTSQMLGLQLCTFMPSNLFFFSIFSSFLPHFFLFFFCNWACVVQAVTEFAISQD